MNVATQKIDLPLLTKKGIKLYVKREDTIHPIISGNKFRKLKYNILEAKKQGLPKLLTFGGAYSNHILATACAGMEHSFDTIGVIRGEELSLKWEDNPTLSMAKQYGMELEFITRELYRQKNDAHFLDALKDKFGHFYLLPEGGTNNLAIKGCEEILNEEDGHFNYICACVGTGGTLSGLINSAKEGQMVLGFPALKGDFLRDDIRKFARNTNWKLIADYHFGGYAKITKELIQFINKFKEETGIPLEPVYTGKLFFGLVDLISKDYFKKGTRILAIHSGGLQGITGMNLVLKKKNLPLLR